jgi:hypothetical protein
MTGASPTALPAAFQPLGVFHNVDCYPRLKIRKDDGHIEVQVRIFKPEKEDRCWICRYEIDWQTGTKRSYAAGVDSVQAILLAFQKIGIELYTSVYHEAGDLMWESFGKGYGFPVSKNVRDVLVVTMWIFKEKCAARRNGGDNGRAQAALGGG